MSLQNPGVFSSRRAGALLLGVLGTAGACGATQSGIAPSGIPSGPASAQPGIESREREYKATYAQLPMRFEQNAGQTDARVRYMARGAGYSLYLTGNEAVLSLKKTGDENGKTAAEAIVRMGLVGSNPAPRVTALERQAGRSNYFRGNDRSRWRRDVPNYGKVQYEEVYPGVDLVFYGRQRELEYDFVVAPGADPDRIRMEFRDHLARHRRPSINDRGELILSTSGGEVVQKKPFAYQVVQGKQRQVACDYTLAENGQVGFRLAAHDPKLPVVIDPILTYASYLGGVDEDEGLAVCADAFGNLYVTGRTDSPNFPLATAYQDTRSGVDDDLFITKFNAAGCSHIYSTYLGGATAQGGLTRADDRGAGIAVDASGNAHVVGATSCSDFPTTVGALQPAVTGGGGDGFVAKFNAAGNDFIYCTYLGGAAAGLDEANGVAIDFKGRAYVVGTTSSPSFPTTPGALQETYGGGTSDGFITKLDRDGASVVWSTFLGGGETIKSDGADYINDIALDPNNVHDSIVYVTGSTESYDFPLVRPFQIEVRKFEAFVAKIDEGGDRILYSTVLGGLQNDSGNGIAVDGNGSVYVAGATGSTQFSNMPDPVFPYGGGDSDAWFAKLHPKATHALYFTYFGGKGTDFANDIVVDASGSAHVVGGMNFPNAATVVNSAGRPRTRAGEGDGFNAPRKGDCFVLHVVPTVPRVASRFFTVTTLGGTKDDQGNDICLDPHGDLYLVGTTNSINFSRGQVKGIVQGDLAGEEIDAFAAKLSLTPYSRLGVTPGGLSFLSRAGSSVERSITIRNSGKKSVGVTIEPPTGPFEVTSGGGQFVLPKGARRTVKVRFDPASVGLFNGELRVISTASGKNACRTLKLRGRAR